MTTNAEFPGENSMRHIMRVSVLTLIAVLLVLPALGQDIISTKIGGGPSDVPAADANLNQPYKVSFDSSGNYYIAAGPQNRVFKVSTTGLLTLIAGNGLAGYSGDGVTGGAINAELNRPSGVAVDSSGNVYIADQNNCVIRQVNPAGTITTFAGTQGTCGGATDNFSYPAGLATDSSGNLYVADQDDCEIKKIVLSTKAVSVVAGDGSCGYTGDGGAATSAELSYPSDVAVDGAGDLFIADEDNYVIREVKSGDISTVAGNHTYGYAGDGEAATSAEFEYPQGVATNSAGTTVTVADTYNQRIRQFTVGGDINTVAGSSTGGFSGDGGLATSAEVSYPQGVALSPSGAYYIADTNNDRVRSFTVGGDIETVAGNGSTTTENYVNSIAPNGVELYDPWGVWEDPSGDVYVADQQNQIVRELVATPTPAVVTTFAGIFGEGKSGNVGNDGPATSAELYYPLGVSRDSSGNIYIADEYNCAIRVVNTAGTINNFAGGNGCGFSGDGGAAADAQLSYPESVYVDSKNNVYIADTDNYVVRKVTDGTISTIAGTHGSSGYAGDGGPATSAKLYYPAAVAEDGAGNIYIADTYNHRIREVNASTGIISTVAGDGSSGFTGDGIATENALYYPYDVKADANGNFFIADQDNYRLRWVDPAGNMITFAGDGSAGYNGDGEVATSAELYSPVNLFEDSSGNFLVSDENNDRIRAITAFNGVGRSVPSITFPIQAVGTMSDPVAVILSGVGSPKISSVTAKGVFSEADNCGALTNGATCEVYVFFTPTAAGPVTGTLTIANNGVLTPSQTISLRGTGGGVVISPETNNFGTELLKTSTAAKTFTIKNDTTGTITGLSVSLLNTTDFAISSNTCGTSLTTKASCTVGVTFTPLAINSLKNTLVVIDSDPTSPQIAGLTGTGTEVEFSETTVNFGSGPDGTPINQNVTLTNVGSTTLTITSGALSGTNAKDFTAPSNPPCGGSVAGNKGTCTLAFTFTPSIVGPETATWTLTDKGGGSPQKLTLTGTGTAAAVKKQ